MNDFPLLVEFVPRTNIYREPEAISKLPIVQNGPPGTFVVFSDGRKVPLPTGQIVFADDTVGSHYLWTPVSQNLSTPRVPARSAVMMCLMPCPAVQS